MIMKPCMTIYICAYNAENYLSETIESVLCQDEPNFELVLHDNGSIDNTYSIMKKYADQDTRIRVLHNDENWKNEKGTRLEMKERCPHPQGEYITYLDSDDILEKNFVSRMYHMAKEHKADIVIAGTTFFKDGTDKVIGKRLPASFVFHAGEQMSVEEFIKTYGSLRPFWGKIYRTDFYLQGMEQVVEDVKKMAVVNGEDTIMSLSYLKQANCVVGIPEALHRYRSKQQGLYVAQNPSPERVREGESLFYHALNIIPKLGLNSKQVKTFLYAIYTQHVKDLIQMLDASLEAEMPKVYALCEEVITNETLAVATEGNGSRMEWAQEIEKPMLLKLLKKEFNFDSKIDSFLQNIVVYFMLPGKIPQGIKNLYLLLGVFHKRNRLLYGNSFVENIDKENRLWTDKLLQKSLTMRIALINCPLLLKEFIENNVAENNELKVKMLDAYDAGDDAMALDMVFKILDENPTDAEGIYFGLVLSYELQQFSLLYVLLDLQKRFWPEHEELQQLVLQVERSLT